MSIQAKPQRPSRLGRGLSSLIGPAPVEVAPLSAPLATPADSGLTWLALTSIRPNPRQPRQYFDPIALQQLADSIKTAGLMQPLVVRLVAGSTDQYELIAGERRWRAAQIAGLERLPASIHNINDEQAAEWALIENLQREDLNAIERARAFARLAEEFGLSHEQIAQKVSSDRSTITNTLRLLALPEEIQQSVVEGRLSAGQARALAGLANAAQQLHLARTAASQAWSVRQVEAAVKKMAAAQNGEITPDALAATRVQRVIPQLQDLENQISQQLGTAVHIRQGKKKGSGSLTIEFYSLDQFDALMARLNVQTVG